MSQAIDDLMHEHDVILTALQILNAICKRIELNQFIEINEIRNFIDFIKEFADKCHHGKEEGHLFPAMIAAGFSMEAGPVAVMLQEHTEGRNWIAQIDESLKPTLNSTSFLRAARGYTNLLGAHIQKENEILFPLAEKVLSPSQLTYLFRAFEEHEDKVIGGGRHEQLHDLLKTMKIKYLGQ